MSTQDLSSPEAVDAVTSATPLSPSVPLARRVVLRAGTTLPLGVGLVSLAACGSDSGADSSTSGGDGGSGDDASADDQGSASEATDEAAAGFPSADVPVGGAVYDEASDTVFSQPSEGEFRAFDATCPHQGCAVSEFNEGSLVCPCHGSMFDPDTGDVVNGPATTGLTTRSVTVQGDDLVVG
ncbi:MAG: Rieske (2Fe-2S) protein [Ornithinimicrobium sp.]